MKRLIKKSQKEYKTKKEIESPIAPQEEELEPELEPSPIQDEPEVEPFQDIAREDPYLGRYVEITNKRSKYYGYHARVEDKFYTDRYKILLEPQYGDDTKGKDYIINFVGVDVASKWFTVVE